MTLTVGPDTGYQTGFSRESEWPGSTQQPCQVHGAINNAYDVHGISGDPIEHHMIADDQQARGGSDTFTQHASFRKILQGLDCLPQSAIEPISHGLTGSTFHPRVKPDQVGLGSA